METGNKLNQDLDAAIENNLSNAQLGVFRREMDRLQAIEAEYTTLRETHKELIRNSTELQAEYEQLKLTIGDLESREKSLLQREQEMSTQKTELHIENQLIDLRRTNAEQRVEDHKNMVGLVFRSPVYKQHIGRSSSGDVLTPVPMSDNGMVGHVDKQFVSSASDETTTIKEE